MTRTLITAGLLILTAFAAAADTPPGQGEDGVLLLQPSKTIPPPEAPSQMPLLPAPPQGLPPLPPLDPNLPPVEDPEPSSLAPEPGDHPSLHTVKAYYVGYAPDSFEAVRRYAATVDIVAGQWLSVDAAGTLRESPSAERNDEVRQIVHAAGRKVYSCVVNSGFSRGVLDRVLGSAARRTAAIDRIIAFVEKKGDDGVDLDFEGVRAGHRAAYTAFVKELAQKLHARGKELSLAVDASWDGSPSPGYDYKALGQYADTIMPMTYTFGPGKVPIGPMEYLETAARVGVRMMDPRKFMIGMGVYGRDYDLSSGRKTNPPSSRIRDLLAAHSPDVTLNPKTATKAFRYKDGNGRGHLVYFDDRETIRAKLARLSQRYGIGAVGFWRMGQEDPGLWNVIEVASRRRPDVTAGLLLAPPSGAE